MNRSKALIKCKLKRNDAKRNEGKIKPEKKRKEKRKRQNGYKKKPCDII